MNTTINTADELDALPVGSVVVDDEGDPWFAVDNDPRGGKADRWWVYNEPDSGVRRRSAYVAGLSPVVRFRPDAPSSGPHDLTGGARVEDYYGDGALRVRWRPDAAYAPLGIDTVGHWSIDTTLDALLDAVVAAGGPDPRPSASSVPVDTTTEWGVEFASTAESGRDVLIRRSEAHARKSVFDGGDRVVRREVTAWREVPS